MTVINQKTGPFSSALSQNVRNFPDVIDFLNIVFECEYGIITFASSEPLRELYELMQMEMVRKIDGTRLAVKVDEIPE